MNFFKKVEQFTECAECGVHFTPLTLPHDSRWAHLCPTHREPVKEDILKRDLVMQWASENYLLLHEQALADMKKAEERRKSLFMTCNVYHVPPQGTGLMDSIFGCNLL